MAFFVILLGGNVLLKQATFYYVYLKQKKNCIEKQNLFLTR